MKDQNVWRIQTDDELPVMYRKPNTVTTTKARRLGWVGHVVRMSDDRTVTKSTFGETRWEKKSRELKIK
jgi:hypothetical protein